MHKLKVSRVGAVIGGFAALCHAVWAGLVAAGWAQPLLDFVFRLHFIAPAWRVQTFDPGAAALLVLLSGLGGFAVGAGLALAWNGLSPRR